MEGYGFLFIIFGILIFLAGLYTATGHKSDLLLWRVHKTTITKEFLKYIGTITEWISIPFILSGLSGFLFKEESIIPLIVLIVSFIVVIILLKNKFKNKQK